MGKLYLNGKTTQIYVPITQKLTKHLNRKPFWVFIKTEERCTTNITILYRIE